MSAFAALGLEPTASVEEVKSAWRTIARRLHPDLGGDPAEFAAMSDNYREALHEASTRPCATCHGTGTIPHTTGWTTIQLPCTSCR